MTQIAILAAARTAPGLAALLDAGGAEGTAKNGSEGEAHGSTMKMSVGGEMIGEPEDGEGNA